MVADHDQSTYITLTVSGIHLEIGEEYGVMKLTIVPKPRVKADGTKTTHVLVYPASPVFKNTANVKNSA